MKEVKKSDKAPYWLSFTSSFMVSFMFLLIAFTSKGIWIILALPGGIMLNVAYDIFRTGMKEGFMSRPD